MQRIDELVKTPKVDDFVKSSITHKSGYPKARKF